MTEGEVCELLERDLRRVINDWEKLGQWLDDVDDRERRSWA